MKNIIEMIRQDKKYYMPEGRIEQLMWYIIKPFSCYTYKAIKYNRLYCYYREKNILLKWICRLRYYRYADKYNFDFLGVIMGKTPYIYHANLVINLHSIIGDNCVFHGSNIIGINKQGEGCPIVGNNVEFGIFSSAIGNIQICDDVCIGAYSLVNKDVLESCKIVGIPANRRI